MTTAWGKYRILRSKGLYFGTLNGSLLPYPASYNSVCLSSPLFRRAGLEEPAPYFDTPATWRGKREGDSTPTERNDDRIRLDTGTEGPSGKGKKVRKRGDGARGREIRSRGNLPAGCHGESPPGGFLHPAHPQEVRRRGHRGPRQLHPL